MGDNETAPRRMVFLLVALSMTIVAGVTDSSAIRITAVVVALFSLAAVVVIFVRGRPGGAGRE
jgi:hypothetical protein